MYSFYLGLVFHLLAFSIGADVRTDKDGKVLLMLEIEPKTHEERSKRASVAEGARQERQSLEVPPEYFNLLQQLSTQQQKQQAVQPQLIQPLLLTREGTKQPAATRYVLAPEGTLLQDSVSPYAQPQQYTTALGQTQISASLGQPAQYPGFSVPVYAQSPLEQTGPQTLPQAPVQPPPPGTRPRISEYARQQQRLLQEYRDAPLRAQIAGVATRPQPQRPVQPVPTGPNSQSAQVFLPPSGQNQRQPQPALPSQFQDPQNPGIVYTPVPVDSQTYLQQYAQLASQQYSQLPQQQLTTVPQQQLSPQYVAGTNQIYIQPPPTASAPQQLYYQQAEATQDKAVRPVTPPPTASSVQPQFVPQPLPQQYLIETTKPASQPPQYVSQEVQPQIQYVQQPVQQSYTPQPTYRQHETSSPSTLLQPVAGRGFFTPSKPPSRSSIYVSRASVPKSISLTVRDEVSSEKVPVVRLPAATGQRYYTKQEYDDLTRAGYAVSATHALPQYLKPKRQPVPHPETARNHVVYENLQDGIQYQYSPGTSDPSVTIKTKEPASQYVA